MLLFRSEEHVRDWCQLRGLPEGGLLRLDQLWGLARAWYADDRRASDWRRMTTVESRALLNGLGLQGPFWELG
jgi:hypothetical protein